MISLDILQLRERDADDRPIDGTGVLAHKGLGGLLLILKEDQRLLLPIHLKELRVDNGAMLFQTVHNLLLCHILWEGGQMDHLRWGTAIAVVLCCIAVEAVEI